MTLAGIEPATFRFVAQHSHRGPQIRMVDYINDDHCNDLFRQNHNILISIF